MNQIKGSLAAVSLISVLLVINVLQTLSLIIKPFSTKFFRSFNRWCANFWWGSCDVSAEFFYGIKIIQTGDELPVAENSIVLLNHQRMTDIPVIFRIARSKKRLGDLKWFVKDVLKFVPGVGWGMLFLDCLFVKRDWLADKTYIHNVFNNINTHKIPVWLMMFAEGTRFSPKKAAQSREYARSKGLKPLDHLLIPRTKGFVVSVGSLREHVKAVYDFTIGYLESPPPTLWQWFKGEVRTVHLHVRRFKVDTLPTGDQALSDWLMQRFIEKDLLLKSFYQNGCFPAALPA